jgi:hypothetical protein
MPNMTANAPAKPTALARIARTTASVVAVVAFAGMLTACPSFSSYFALRAAYNPPPPNKVQPVTPPGSPALKLYAGDCNFRLPEGDFRLSPDIRKIVERVRRSDLDFVFFTPTLSARFFEKEGGIEQAIHDWKDVRQFLDTIPDPKPLFLPGAEYVDKNNGTVSLLFLDLPTLFTELKARDFKGSPPLFFYTAKAFGALLAIDTPLATPLSVPYDSHQEKYATTDRSWHPYTEKGRTLDYFPPEIKAAHELSYGLEAYSLPVAIWRDQYGIGDPLTSVLEVLKVMDKQILERHRRMVPVAGSDTHGRILHPMMYIAAPTRTQQALREGMLRGRVCIRSPEPCGMRVYADDDAIPQGVGAALRAHQRLEFDWKGEGELVKNGESAGTFDGHATMAADPQCSVYRLVLDGGYSAPVYVNCPWAEHELQY